MDEEDGSKGKSGQQTLDFVQAHRSRHEKTQQGRLTAVHSIIRAVSIKTGLSHSSFFNKLTSTHTQKPAVKLHSLLLGNSFWMSGV